MATIERVVNVIPYEKIKQEVIDFEEDDYLCKLCPKGFANEVALRNHARIEHIEAFLTEDSTQWTSDQSPAIIGRKQLLSGLMSLASKDVSYVLIKNEDSPACPQPEVKPTTPPQKKKKTEKKITPHQRKEKVIEPIIGPFECLQPSTMNLVADGTCHQIFFSCCEYTMHLRDDHMRRKKTLKCEVCEKLLVDNVSEHPCELCGAGFDTYKDLSEHLTMAHVKLKPFECSVCHKRFTQQGGVQQHMRMHTGERPFPCTVCNKAFTQKSGLDQHLRIHTKCKPYRCIVCSKSFIQSVHLKQHMRTHTNVAPFQCGICNKRFKQSSHLNYHLKNHNPAHMTDEQRIKYAELISLMNNQLVKVEHQAQEIEVSEETSVTQEETEYINHPMETWCVITELNEGSEV